MRGVTFNRGLKGLEAHVLSVTDVYERSTADSKANRDFGDDPLNAVVDRVERGGTIAKAVGTVVAVAAVGLAIGSLGSGLVAFMGSLVFVFAVLAAVAGGLVAAGIYGRRALGYATRAASRRLTHN